jgi:hypothetical protein
MAASLRSAEASSSSTSSSGGGSLVSALGLGLFQERRYFRPLLVGMSLMLFQQVCGVGCQQQRAKGCCRHTVTTHTHTHCPPAIHPPDLSHTPDHGPAERPVLCVTNL